MIKEAMHISKLEDDKKQGKIDLGFLKRKNQKKPEKDEAVSSIIPAPSTAAESKAFAQNH